MTKALEIKSSMDLVGMTFPEALDRTGMTAEFIAQKMMEFATAVDDSDMPIYNVQLKGIDMANRCQGNYQDKMQIEPVHKTEDKLENSIIEKISNQGAGRVSAKA